MFTGLIEEVGQIVAVSSSDKKRYFDIKCKKVLSDLQVGASIACNGICLTAIEISSDYFKAEAMNETLSKTTAKYWEVGTPINLERALKANNRLEGHFVLGHVDTVGQINSRSYIGDTLYLEFIIPERFYPLVVEKGSVAINGISLTVASLKDYGFSIALIGHTLENTNIKMIKDYVNIEFDVIGKYIQRNISLFEIENDNEIDVEWLENNGF